MSNATLNTPWPKVTRARQHLQSYIIKNENLTTETLMEQLADNKLANEADLPNTGVGLELERKLSPIFIQTEHYGTRSSTVLLVTHDKHIEMTERTFKKGIFEQDIHFTFPIAAT